MKNIVVIGGGTGTYTVLLGLKKYPVNLAAVVSMADDGGSTKILREEFGVLPPGSVRPAMVALSEAGETLTGLFNYRFSEGSLKGHNFGNLFLTALTKQLGSFEKAIDEAGKLLKLQGRVIPSTLEDIRLCVELGNGQVIEGETNIDVPQHDGNLKIEKVWLQPAAKANPKAIESVKNADLIVIGPGDLYSSIIPNFLVQGMKEALRASRAKKVYVCNLMTKFGETTRFTAHDFVAAVESHIGDRIFDYVIVNTKRPSKERVREYEKENAKFVEYNLEKFKGANFRIVEHDVMRVKGLVHHDPDILAQLLYKIVTKK